MFITCFQMSRVYTAQDALEIILNGGESDFESSDDEEMSSVLPNYLFPVPRSRPLTSTGGSLSFPCRKSG